MFNRNGSNSREADQAKSSLFSFFKPSDTAAPAPVQQSSSRKKEKHANRPPESLPPQQYGRYAPPPPSPSLNSPTFDLAPLPDVLRTGGGASAASPSSRELFFTTSNKEELERERRMLRELQTSRHRPSNSLGSPVETSFPPFDTTSHLPTDATSFISNLPPLSSHSSLPSLSDMASDTHQELSHAPPFQPTVAAPARSSPKPQTSTNSQAAWGDLLSRTAAHSKPGLHGPAFFQKPVGNTDSNESPLPSPGFMSSSNQRSVSNPSSSTTASTLPKPAAPIPVTKTPQPPRNKKRPSYPKGPNSGSISANIVPSPHPSPSQPRTPPTSPGHLIDQPLPPPRPPFKNHSSSSGGSWDALLAQHPRSSPPVDTSSLPPLSIERPSNPIPTTTTTAISAPWENLLALAANSSTPGQAAASSKSRLPSFKVPFISSSAEPSSSRNQSVSPSQPPIVLPPLDFDFITAPITSPPPPANSPQAITAPTPSHLPSSFTSGKPNVRLEKNDRASPSAPASRTGTPAAKPKTGGGGMISGFVRAPEGKKELRPGQKAQMATSACICCAATLQYPISVTSFRCTVCGTISDLNLSDRRAAGLAKESDPLPLSLARFQALLDAGRSTDLSRSSRVEGLEKDAYDGLDSDVEAARTVEGGESDGEAAAEIPRRDGGASSEQKEEWWTSVAFELERVFSHWSSLGASFSTDLEPTLNEPSISLPDVQSFFALLSTIPVELSQSIAKGLESLFRRPRRRFDSALAGKGLSWVLLILEFKYLWTRTEDQACQSVVKRYLGLVSNLSNEHHHYLVQWLCLYSPEEFEERLGRISAALTPRIAKYSLSVPPPASRSSNPQSLPWHCDWRFRSGARFLSLFFAANAEIGKPIAVSKFYVDRLDALDVVNDFEVWARTAGSSSKSTFFLTQYPFLLSLSAKLRVLVHDSRQQQSQSSLAFDSHGNRVLSQPYISIRVRRDRLLEDSLAQVSNSISHLKMSLRISFVGEEGVDAGGLKKEWFVLLVRELFDPAYGMFLYDEDSQLCFFNPASLESADQYLLTGVIVGLATYHSTSLDIRLPSCVYKLLLNRPVGLEDLEIWRPSLALGLRKMLSFEGDVEEVYCRTFVGEYESFGETVTEPLFEGGENVAVTNSNREEYVHLLVQFILRTSVSRHFQAFQRGYLSVCEGNALSLFHSEELELLVSGSPESLDVDQLRSITTYEGFRGNEHLIESFWEIVHGFTVEQQHKLLTFVTASPRIPATGLSALNFKITAAVHAPLDHLPTSHTCFNALALPLYRTKETLEFKLLAAIDLSSGFGLK